MALMTLSGLSASRGTIGALSLSPASISVAPRAIVRALTCTFYARLSGSSYRHAAGTATSSIVTKAVANSSSAKPANAKEAVEAGLVAFQKEKDYATAVRLFSAALELQPSDDEAMAALFNLGCAQAKLKQWGPATEAIMSAVNDYSLKITVALQDDDLRELRERREWVDAATKMKGGMSEAAKVELRAEAKAPFRLPRLYLFGALALGGGIGLLVTSTQIFGGLGAGQSVSDLAPTLQNFAVNAGVLIIATILIQRDLKSKDRSVQITSREEKLSRLQVDLGKNRQLPLGRFRGKVRPVIVAGSKQFVERAVKEAQPFYENLRARGISVIPVVLGVSDKSGGAASSSASDRDPNDPEERIRALKRELQKQDGSNKGFGGASTSGVAAAEVATSTSSAAATEVASETGVSESDRKWRLEAYDKDEWRSWVEDQRLAVGAPVDRRDCFVQVQLDGTVRSSGLGMPPWAAFVDDLPPLDSVRTTFSDGIGPSM